MRGEEGDKNGVEVGKKREGWKGDEVVIGRDIEGGEIERDLIVKRVNYEKGEKLEWRKGDVEKVKEGWNEERGEEGVDVGEKGKRLWGEEREESVGWNKER